MQFLDERIGDALKGARGHAREKGSTRVLDNSGSSPGPNDHETGGTIVK